MKLKLHDTDRIIFKYKLQKLYTFYAKQVNKVSDPVQ
jgi:hypothetical protein